MTLDGEEPYIRKRNRDYFRRQTSRISWGTGGLDTEISDETTTVLLEAALFDPKAVRLASQKT